MIAVLLEVVRKLDRVHAVNLEEVDVLKILPLPLTDPNYGLLSKASQM